MQWNSATNSTLGIHDLLDCYLFTIHSQGLAFHVSRNTLQSRFTEQFFIKSRFTEHKQPDHGVTKIPLPLLPLPPPLIKAVVNQLTARFFVFPDVHVRGLARSVGSLYLLLLDRFVHSKHNRPCLSHHSTALHSGFNLMHSFLQFSAISISEDNIFRPFFVHHCGE